MCKQKRSVSSLCLTSIYDTNMNDISSYPMFKCGGAVLIPCHHLSLRGKGKRWITTKSSIFPQWEFITLILISCWLKNEWTVLLYTVLHRVISASKYLQGTGSTNHLKQLFTILSLFLYRERLHLYKYTPCMCTLEYIYMYARLTWWMSTSDSMESLFSAHVAISLGICLY